MVRITLHISLDSLTPATFSEHETVMATIKQFLGFNIPSKDEDEEPRTKRRQQEKGKVTKMKLKKTE